jgi:hypothetical protein
MISAQKWYISCANLGIFSDLFCKLSKEKLLIIVFIPFMLYMSDSTQFMQEMTSKEQERSFCTKVSTLKRLQHA